MPQRDQSQAVEAVARAPMWPLFDVTVQGFPPLTYQAATRGKALSMAYGDYGILDDRIKFGAFLRIASARRRHDVPADDHYGPVRRQYGVDPTVEQRVRLQHEGDWSGREGTVLFPRSPMCHVLVLVDGENEPVRVHPMNVVFLPVGRAMLSASVQDTGAGVGNG